MNLGLAGDDGEEGSDFITIIYDIHEAIDRTAWDWASIDSHGDHIEALAREQAAFQAQVSETSLFLFLFLNSRY